MAEDIGRMCRDYIDGKLRETDGLGEAEALAVLIRGAEAMLHKAGWGGQAAIYGVNVEEIAKERLSRRRSAN
jgi:hypothetical protein